MKDSRELQKISVKINNLYAELNSVKLNMGKPDRGRGYIESALNKLEQAEDCIDTAIEYIQT